MTSGCVGRGRATSARRRAPGSHDRDRPTDLRERRPRRPARDPGPDARDPSGRRHASSVSRTGAISPAHIPGARYVELPGMDNLIWAGDQDAMVAEIQDFVTGVRPAPEPHRVLATVLFTDIVGSTERAAQLGDARWEACSPSTTGSSATRVERFGGREVKTVGDGVLATFDGPARAVRGALAIRDGGAGARAGDSGRPPHRRNRGPSRRHRRARRPHRPHGSRPWPAPARCSCRAPSRTWSSAPASCSTIAARTCSRVCPASGRCSRSGADAGLRPVGCRHANQR